jgi:ribonuclease HI
MSMSLLPYIVFVDGSSRSTQNLVSISWEIYAPMDEFISLHGVFLGHETNNIMKYNAVIEFLFDAISFGICHLIVQIDS